MASAPYKTPCGLYIDLANPRINSIRLSDIAWNLASICRYGGSTLDHYSVAQHCVLMDSMFLLHTINPLPTVWPIQVQSLIKASDNDSSLLKRLRIELMLHDASEAYLGDIPSPLKNLLPQYKVIEAQWMEVIRTAFHLPPLLDMSKEDEDIQAFVKCMDILALHIERRWVQVKDAQTPPVGVWGEEESCPVIQATAENWLSLIDQSFWGRETARKAFEGRFNLIARLS